MAATLDSSDGPVPETMPSQPSVEELANELEKTDIQNASDTQSEDTQPPDDAEPSSPRPLIIYTRKQMLHLSQSPLVKPPAGMPDFKSWFGYVVLIGHESAYSFTRIQRVQRANSSRHQEGLGDYKRQWLREGQEVSFYYLQQYNLE